MSASPLKTSKQVATTRFWGMVRYELLWNIRKKKFVGMVVLGLILSIVPLALSAQSATQNPNYITNSSGIGGLVLFFFALVTVMNSISGEFESGSIVPLLTKPISRTEIFMGKLVAAIITLLPVYALLFAVEVIGGTVIYGPQNNLALVPLSLVGAIASTLVWITIVLAVGCITKSSLITAIGSFAAYITTYICSGIVLVFGTQLWFLTYLPGTGAIGTIGQTASLTNAASIMTGTDGIASTLVNYVLHPSATVAFIQVNAATAAPLYSEPLLNALLISLALATVYICAFLCVAWYALSRTQVNE
jgi:ABC-type transport system involved in multi-copper enzyme maturation permease subunit